MFMKDMFQCYTRDHDIVRRNDKSTKDYINLSHVAYKLYKLRDSYHERTKSIFFFLFKFFLHNIQNNGYEQNDKQIKQIKEQKLG